MVGSRVLVDCTAIARISVSIALVSVRGACPEGAPGAVGCRTSETITNASTALAIISASAISATVSQRRDEPAYAPVAGAVLASSGRDGAANAAGPSPPVNVGRLYSG